MHLWCERVERWSVEIAVELIAAIWCTELQSCWLESLDTVILVHNSALCRCGVLPSLLDSSRAVWAGLCGRAQKGRMLMQEKIQALLPDLDTLDQAFPSSAVDMPSLAGL